MFNIPNSVSLDLPYPEIEGATSSPQTVKILQNLYSSRNSETVATLMYSYQHFIAEKINSEISELLIKIGIVEMRHMDLLAEAIIDFGGNPLFQDNQGTWLSGSWVNYATSLVKMLEIDIAGEQLAYENYIKAAQAVENESLKQLLERIALDEKNHAEILSDLLKQVRFWLGDV